MKIKQEYRNQKGCNRTNIELKHLTVKMPTITLLL